MIKRVKEKYPNTSVFATTLRHVINANAHMCRITSYNVCYTKLLRKKVKWLSLNMVKFSSDSKRKKWLIQIEKYFANLK